MNYASVGTIVIKVFHYPTLWDKENLLPQKRIELNPTFWFETAVLPVDHELSK